MSLFLNGIETNTVMWNGVETTGVWNGEVVWGSSPIYTLTLQTDGRGTLTANTLTGYPGDTITLTPTYNTYYRFNNYSNTGGSIAGNVFTFGDSDATAQANFKVNAFTASGGFEKGSDVNCKSPVANNGTSTANVGSKYITASYHTSNVPTAWYNTSNRWKVTSTVSAYKITINANMGFQTQFEKKNYGAAKISAWSIIGSTTGNLQTWSTQTANNVYYSKTITSTSTGVNYGVAGKLYAETFIGHEATASYIANRTTGTWTATGYAP